MPPTDQETHARGDKYAPTAWGQVVEDIEVPSGQTCQVRRPGVQGLMAAGVLDDVDFLSTIVSEEHIKRVEGRPTVDSTAFEDPTALKKAMHTIDSVVCYVVLQPKLTISSYEKNGEILYISPEERDDDTLYAESVDLEDKMFIFNYALGGSRDLERFRTELDEAMGDMEPKQVVATEAE
jgi:hypothetical protein